jgi:hypothetical protein
MFKVETIKAYSMEEFASLQIGWDFSVSQLGPSEESFINLFRTAHVGYQCFRYGPSRHKLCQCSIKIGLMGFPAIRE